MQKFYGKNIFILKEFRIKPLWSKTEVLGATFMST